MNNFHILTCALPYANGNLHIGHFFEATLADIAARYRRQTQKDNFLFVSGADCHGAATTLYCQQQGLDIPTHLKAQHRAFTEAYGHLQISFDNFSQTNTELHKKVLGWCVENILGHEKKYHTTIFQTREVKSWYDPISAQFLPDRYVKGICPFCAAIGQTAEVCDNCHKAISPGELLEPRSVLTQQRAELKATEHLLLNTESFYTELKNQASLLHPSIRNKILDHSLENQKFLDISRDGPYYGIEIDKQHFPQLENQYFYVWFDAPLGYLTFAFEASGLEQTKENFQLFLKDLSLEHFIGKDIAYFHTFLWLNLLKVVSNGQSSVAQLHFHGWLTQNQQKLSKSQGNSFDIQQLSLVEVDALRLYFFSKSDGSIEDQEFQLQEVSGIYNQLITNGLANFYARTLKVLEKHNIQLSLPFSEVLSERFSLLLNSGNYKKLFLTLQSELGELNTQFQNKALWTVPVSGDTTELLTLCQDWITQWYEIYLVLVLVCPQLASYKAQIHSQTFVHLASKLPVITLRVAEEDKSQ